MTLADRLRTIAGALPLNGSVTLTRSDLEELLTGEGEARGDTECAGVDLTVKQMAARLDRGASTIRTWAAAGLFPHAYRLRDREWRIPASDIGVLQGSESAGFKPKPPTRSRPARAVDTSEWRKHLPTTQAPF